MMTNLNSRTTSRSIAAVAAVAAASTLAACGSTDSSSASDVPKINSSSSTPSTSTSTKVPEAKAAPKPAAKPTEANRASRSQTRQAIPSVKFVNWSQAERIDNKTVYVYSANLPKGTSQVTQAGHDGLATVTYRTAKNGTRIMSTKAVDSKVTKNAVRRIITVGTGQAQPVVKKTVVKTVVAPAAQQQVSRSTVRRAVTHQAAPQRKAVTQTRRTASAPAVANGGMWDRIAQCESTGNWHINTGNGYYGGLQFNQQTWLGAGGGAYAPRADLASKAQQIAVANKVYGQRGLQPWECGHAA